MPSKSLAKKRLTVLLLDDDRVHMPVFSDELSFDDFSVTQVADKRELELLVELNYDCLLLDLMFPPLHGLPLDRTDLGYMAGVFFYEEHLCGRMPEVPFWVLTAVDPATIVFKKSIAELSRYTAYKGFFRKPPIVDDVALVLRSEICGVT